MPEGHTIHRIARDHQREFGGQKLKISSPQGRFSDGAKKLSGKKLNEVHAHGKHLCYQFSAGKLLHIHLGLYGKFRPHKVPPPEPRGAVRIRVIGEKKAFDLNGPNCCELISKDDWTKIQDRLGPDPLRKDANPELVWERVQKSRQAIGKLLLDQSVVAGVGNVYRAEALFLLGIHPERPGKEVTRSEFDALWKMLVELLEIGVKYNRIIIADPKDIGKPRSKMNREERLLIYKHKICTKCDGEVDWFDLGARKAYACKRCQS
jgi:endonuclease-8